LNLDFAAFQRFFDNRILHKDFYAGVVFVGSRGDYYNSYALIVSVAEPSSLKRITGNDWQPYLYKKE